MMNFRNCTLSLAVLCFLALSATHANAGKEPVPKLVKSTSTDAAILYQQPQKPDASYTYTKVPTFPGVSFYATVCGGPNVDRTAKVSKSMISYEQGRGVSGNSMTIKYFFKDARLEVTVFKKHMEKALIKNLGELSALLDKSSDRQIQNFAAGERKAAVSALDTLINYLDRFSSPNQEAACMAYLLGQPDQPYSPELLKLIAYLRRTRNTIINFKQERKMML